jgi:hypothetical protein
MYETQKTVPGDPVGLEPLFVSNIVGSPVLQSVFPSYACAIDPPSCNSALPQPVQPVAPSPYVGYEAAFGTTAFGIAAYGAAPNPAPFTIDTEGPGGRYPAIQSAMVTVPIFSNPFDLTSPVTGQASELLHYVPLGEGGGFPVTVDGTRDAFFNTYAIGFSGNSFSATLDYDVLPLGYDGGMETVVRAVQASNYLGLVFACAAPSNSQTPPSNSLLYGDILAVRMNESVADIMAWISGHPNMVDSCNVQILYGNAGSTPQAISFLDNGVRFDLAAGLDGQVVSSVTLFDPNVLNVFNGQ